MIFIAPKPVANPAFHQVKYIDDVRIMGKVDHVRLDTICNGNARTIDASCSFEDDNYIKKSIADFKELVKVIELG